MDRSRRFRQLEALAALHRQAETASLARQQRRLGGMQSQVDRLQDAAVERLHTAATLSPFQKSGCDGLWDAWRQDRIRELAVQMSRLHAEMEQQSGKVRRAVGRHLVLERLSARIDCEAERKRARRADAVPPPASGVARRR